MALFRKTYAQVAEDLLAAYYLQKETEVTYIDVGCLWPVQQSSTYFFYERGGHGVCIDPNPSAGDQYRAERPRDIFVNCGVAATEGALVYRSYENPVFNTFSDARADELAAAPPRKGRNLIGTTTIPVRPLTQIMHDVGWVERYGSAIDILSIDVEGFEVEVIRSLDFDYVKPTLVVMEMALKAERVRFNQAKQILLDRGYTVCGETGHDMFLINRS